MHETGVCSLLHVKVSLKSLIIIINDCGFQKDAQKFYKWFSPPIFTALPPVVEDVFVSSRVDASSALPRT